MRKAFARFSFLIATLTISTTAFCENLTFSFLSTTIELMDSASSAQLLRESDDYTKALTKFDLQGRLMTQEEVTEADYLKFAAGQARSWTEHEKAQFKDAFQMIANYFEANRMTLKLPEKIQMVKSIGDEEFGAEGYTRRNFIVLKAGGPEAINPGIVSHELFHVYSRFNKETRDKLYDIIGFKPSNPIAYNESIGGMSITNPDCPVVEHYITLGKKDLAVILYSLKPYAGGNVLEEYANVGLLELKSDGVKKYVKEDKATIYELNKFPELMQKTGGNTSYVLHPEEVCAEHFAMLVNGKKVKSPEHLDKMKAVLKEAGKD
ncbi:MAG: hypothetical protein EOP56_16325 [Sphingobacteriales bacterium]|nr:MAG: hypothetical protein EOP56_16325 [Sphingobacteriales bacterium]